MRKKPREEKETYNSIQKIRKVLNSLFCYLCVGVDFQYRNTHSFFDSSRSKHVFSEQLKSWSSGKPFTANSGTLHEQNIEVVDICLDSQGN